MDNPGDYPCSSARNYNVGDHSVIGVDCEGDEVREPDTHMRFSLFKLNRGNTHL